MHQDIPITICIISNRTDSLLKKVLNSFSGFNVLLGVNGQNLSSIEALKMEFPEVRIETIAWQGYGRTKNLLASMATTPWILSVDSDEEADEELIAFLKQVPLEDKYKVYALRRWNKLGNQVIRNGVWGRTDKSIIRLYHRDIVSWDEAAVHERLVMPEGVEKIQMPGGLYHYTAANIEQVRAKNRQYAQLFVNQRRYKKRPLYKKFLSPLIAFLRSYVFLLGFLDGKYGFQLSWEYARYTWWKYSLPPQD